MTRTRSQPATYLCLFAILLVASALFFEAARAFAAEPGPDQSWLLLIAQRMLHGAQLYGPQISETNPPLIIWFSTIAIALASLLHCSPNTGLILLLLACVTGATLWSYRLFRRSSLQLTRSFLVLFALTMAFVELWSGSSGFGEREQFFFVLALPYVLYVSLGAAPLSLPERLGLGITAGFAVCLKPQEALVLVALELYTALATRGVRRLQRAEFLALVLTCLAYVASVRLFAPLYFTDTLPRLRLTYWALADGTALQTAVRLGSNYILFLLLAGAVFLLRRRKLNLDASLVASLLVCAIGALLACVQQRTNWPYHFAPARFFLRLAFAWIACRALAQAWQPERLRRTYLVPAAAVCAALFLAVNILGVRESLQRQRPAVLPSVDTFFAQLHPGTTIYVFSTMPDAVAKSTRWHLVWGSRFAHLWMLPAIVRNESIQTDSKYPFVLLPPQAVHNLALTQQTETMEDLERWQPKIVLVQHCTVEHWCEGLLGRNFDILPWFLQSDAFAREWKHYQPAQGAPIGFDLYTRVN